MPTSPPSNPDDRETQLHLISLYTTAIRLTDNKSSRELKAWPQRVWNCVLGTRRSIRENRPARLASR